MAGVTFPAIFALGLVGCADQGFISETAGNWSTVFQTAVNADDSNEPQTNSVPYALDSHDIKEVEDVPLEELEEFDLTGPQNSGILKTDTNTLVGNDDADLDTENKPCIYIYTAGNPENSADGKTTLKTDGVNEIDGVIIPNNVATLKNLTGVKDLTKLKYSADEFQTLLVQFSEAVNNAYKGAKNPTSEWCNFIGGATKPKTQKLEAAWGLFDSDEGKNISWIEYNLGDDTRKAKCTGIYSIYKGSRHETYVTPGLWWKYYTAKTYSDIQLPSKVTNKDGKLVGDGVPIFGKEPADVSAYTTELKFLHEGTFKKIPILNAAVWQCYSTTNGESPMITMINSQTYSLKASFTTDSMVGTTNGEALAKFGSDIQTNCGTTVTVNTDKDESSMYHSFLSAAVEARKKNAAVIVSVNGKGTGKTTIEISGYDKDNSGNTNSIKTAWDEKFAELSDSVVLGIADDGSIQGSYMGIGNVTHADYIPYVGITLGSEDLDKIAETLAEILKDLYMG